MTGSYDKAYEVIPATAQASRKKYTLGGREYSFQGHNAFYVRDKSAAADLEALHGGTSKSDGDDLRVIPIDDMPKDPTGVHKYSFSLQQLGDWKSKIDWS